MMREGMNEGRAVRWNGKRRVKNVKRIILERERE
jgi:hypothetical protein